MHLEEELSNRGYVVARALANLRARGVEPQPEVLALYACYVRGELSRSEVHAEMLGRYERLQERLAKQVAANGWAVATAAAAPDWQWVRGAAERLENALAAGS